MEYLKLKKAYYKEEIDFNKLYNERFNSPNTIKFPIYINEKQSFIYLN